MQRTRMSKRLTVTLPDQIYGELVKWAETRGQSVAPLAAIAVERSVRQAKDAGEFSMEDK